jgi:hypothetical protein
MTVTGIPPINPHWRKFRALPAFLQNRRAVRTDARHVGNLDSGEGLIWRFSMAVGRTFSVG